MLSKMNLQECYRASNDRSGCDCCRRPGRGGFTLAEILIALGILAIGMAMVAAIFPAALEFNRSSTNNTLGTIICENGMVLSELALTAEIVTDTNLTVFADDKNENYLTWEQQRYPTCEHNEDDTETEKEEKKSKTGFVMMACKDSNAEGIYKIITVAYRKNGRGDEGKKNTVQVVDVGCSVTEEEGILTIKKGGGNLRIGSPLINRANGEFAVINSIDEKGNNGTLDVDTKIREPSGITSGNQFYVLVERDDSGNAIDIEDMRRSPAIQIMSKVTGLRSAP